MENLTYRRENYTIAGTNLFWEIPTYLLNPMSFGIPVTRIFWRFSWFFSQISLGTFRDFLLKFLLGELMQWEMENIMEENFSNPSKIKLMYSTVLVHRINTAEIDYSKETVDL